MGPEPENNQANTSKAELRYVIAHQWPSVQGTSTAHVYIEVNQKKDEVTRTATKSP
jgi:hypothetical protein